MTQTYGEQQTYGAPPVQNLSVSGPSDHDAVSVTIRAGSAQDPVVIFKGGSNAEVADLLGAAQASGLFALIGQAAVDLKGHFNVGSVLNGTPAQAPSAGEQQYYQGQAPQQGQQAPQQAYNAPQQGYGQQAPQQQYGQQQQQQAPQRAAGPLATPPGVVPSSCPHGVKSLINGKFGPFWACPAQREDPSKCKAEKYHGPTI